MKQHPILFSTPMVRAERAGNKNQTRRIVTKHRSGPCDTAHKSWLDWDTMYPNNPFGIKVLSKLDDTFHRVYPPYEVGDHLWVKETWQHTKCLGVHPSDDELYGYVYKADDQPWEDYEGWKWKSSMFMPKEAARTFLEVTGIRVERLLDITEEDARSEGVMADCNSFIKGFALIWENINGQGSWEANPLIWKISFQRTYP